MTNADTTLKRNIHDLEKKMTEMQQKEKEQLDYLRLLDSKIELLLQLGGATNLPLPQPTPRNYPTSPVVPSITVDFADSAEEGIVVSVA